MQPLSPQQPLVARDESLAGPFPLWEEKGDGDGGEHVFSQGPCRKRTTRLLRDGIQGDKGCAGAAGGERRAPAGMPAPCAAP